MDGTVLMAAKVAIYMQIANSDYIAVNSNGNYTVTRPSKFTISAIHYPTGGAGSETDIAVNGSNVLSIGWTGSVTQKSYQLDAKEGDVITFTNQSFHNGHICSSAMKLTITP